LTVLGALVFLSPRGALVVVAVAMPVAAAMIRARRRARTRAVLGLNPPRGRDIAELASLIAVPLLLAFAAAGPAIRSPAGRGVLNNAEAIFVFDTSRSMGAAAGAHAPTRLDQAKTAARELREAIPDVPSGVASLTTQLLPELFSNRGRTRLRWDRQRGDRRAEAAAASVRDGRDRLRSARVLAGSGFLHPERAA
jgi:hypothetical protein